MRFIGFGSRPLFCRDVCILSVLSMAASAAVESYLLHGNSRLAATEGLSRGTPEAMSGCLVCVCRDMRRAFVGHALLLTPLRHKTRRLLGRSMKGQSRRAEPVFYAQHAQAEDKMRSAQPGEVGSTPVSSRRTPSCCSRRQRTRPRGCGVSGQELWRAGRAGGGRLTAK